MDITIEKSKLLSTVVSDDCKIVHNNCCNDSLVNSQKYIKVETGKLRIPGSLSGSPTCYTIPSGACCGVPSEGGPYINVGLQVTKQKLLVPLNAILEQSCSVPSECPCDDVIVPCLGGVDVPRFYTVTTFKFSSALGGRTICSQSVIEYQTGEDAPRGLWLAIGNQLPTELVRCGLTSLGLSALVSSPRCDLGLMPIFSPNLMYYYQFSGAFPVSPFNIQLSILEPGDNSTINADLYNSFEPMDDLPDAIGFYHPLYEDYLVIRKSFNLSYGGLSVPETSTMLLQAGPQLNIFRYGDDYLLFWGDDGTGFVPSETTFFFWGERVGDELHFEIPGDSHNRLPAGINNVVFSARTWPFPSAVLGEFPRPAFWNLEVDAPLVVAYPTGHTTNFVAPNNRSYSTMNEYIGTTEFGGQTTIRLVNQENSVVYDKIVIISHTRPILGTDSDFRLSYMLDGGGGGPFPYSSYTVDGPVHTWIYEIEIDGIPARITVHT